MINLDCYEELANKNLISSAQSLELIKIIRTMEDALIRSSDELHAWFSIDDYVPHAICVTQTKTIKDTVQIIDNALRMVE